MKADVTTKLYKSIGVKEDHKSVNKLVKAVIVLLIAALCVWLAA